MSSGDELVKIITERVVHYVETPKEIRRLEHKPREPWVRKWFGMVPFSIELWWENETVPLWKEWRKKHPFRKVRHL